MSVMHNIQTAEQRAIHLWVHPCLCHFTKLNDHWSGCQQWTSLSICNGCCCLNWATSLFDL